MRELKTNEVPDVSGGIMMLAPFVWGMCLDTGFYGAMGMSFGLGYSFGSLANSAGAGGEDLTNYNYF